MEKMLKDTLASRSNKLRLQGREKLPTKATAQEQLKSGIWTNLMHYYLEHIKKQQMLKKSARICQKVWFEEKLF